MTSPQPPTRADLARFIADPRTLRAFENLFAQVPGGFEELTARLSDVEAVGALAGDLASAAKSDAATIARALQDLANAIATQRGQQSTIAALERRLSDLEALVLTGD
jgi:ABC-type transporter Mla subunit MlaD